LTNESRSSGPDYGKFSQRIHELKSSLVKLDPFRTAFNTASTYKPINNKSGEFLFKLWGDEITVKHPEYITYIIESGQEALTIDQALVLYYFNTSDGTPLSGRWISFSDLPNGRFYNQAFQGYTGHQLTRAFQNNQDKFVKAARIQGGIQHSLGSTSYAFQVLPRVPLLAVFWLGDDEFPSSFQILFDGSASHYLPTDAYAILGSTLTRRLIKEAASLSNQITNGV